MNKLQIMKFACISVFLLLLAKETTQSILLIVSGNEIDISKCPYQLSLLKSNKHACGAVAINKLWAVTTAACVKGIPVKDISLRGGSSSHNSGGTVYNAEKIVLHASYNENTKDYNIALIQVSKSFDLKTTKPITLATEGSIVKPGSQVLVTGWGALTAGGSIFPQKLHQITIPTIEQATCKIANGNNISDRMLCAGLTSGGKDICTGDFGGPMVYQDKLIGISSWSISCGKPGNYGVYTSVSNLRGWIKKTSGV